METGRDEHNASLQVGQCRSGQAVPSFFLDDARRALMIAQLDLGQVSKRLHVFYASAWCLCRFLE